MNNQKKILIGAAAVAVVLIIVVLAMNLMGEKKQPENSSQQNTQQTQQEAPKKEVKPPASFAEGYEQVETGMTKADVEILLGKPMAECKVIDIKQLNQKMETCSYKDPASTNPASLPDATVDFSEDGKVTMKQKY